MAALFRFLLFLTHNNTTIITTRRKNRTSIPFIIPKVTVRFDPVVSVGPSIWVGISVVAVISGETASDVVMAESLASVSGDTFIVGVSVCDGISCVDETTSSDVVMAGATTV